MAFFESGVENYLHFSLNLDITFPIDRKGNAIISCEYCKVFTGRRCAITEEVIFEPQKYVGFNCPLKKGGKQKCLGCLMQMKLKQGLQR